MRTAGGWRRATEDERFVFVIRVATGSELDLEKIVEQLRAWSYQED
jgi:death on curing protein